MRQYTAIVGMILTCVIFLRIAIRGATCIIGERDQHTLDELLTTDLTNREILFGKWLGCMWGMRRSWRFLFLFWIVGLLSGGVDLRSIPILILSTAIYASVFSCLGILTSLYCSTAQKAIISSIIATTFFGGLGTFVPFTILFEPLPDYCHEMAGAALCLPWSLMFLTHWDWIVQNNPFSKHPADFFGMICLSLIGWIFLSVFLARQATKRELQLRI
jgi:ABC-type transport system involved in multi-copper enzyme maturation permease subunit